MMSAYFDFPFSGEGVMAPLRHFELKFPKDDPIFLTHFPSYPVLPASLLTDICCRAFCTAKNIDGMAGSGWFIAWSTFREGIRPGDTVSVIVESDDHTATVSVIRAGKDVATLELAVDAIDAVQDTNKPVEIPLRPALSKLPHRYPLLVVDLIGQAQQGDRGAARKFVSYGDYCFRHLHATQPDHVPPSYPNGAVIEGIEQAAAGLLATKWDLANPAYVVLVAGLNGVRFFGLAQPGDVIDFHTRIDTISDRLAILSGRAMVGRKDLISLAKAYVVRQEIAR